MVGYRHLALQARHLGRIGRLHVLDSRQTSRRRSESLRASPACAFSRCLLLRCCHVRIRQPQGLPLAPAAGPCSGPTSRPPAVDAPRGGLHRPRLRFGLPNQPGPLNRLGGAHGPAGRVPPGTRSARPALRRGLRAWTSRSPDAVRTRSARMFDAELRGAREALAVLRSGVQRGEHLFDTAILERVEVDLPHQCIRGAVKRRAHVAASRAANRGASSLVISTTGSG